MWADLFCIHVQLNKWKLFLTLINIIKTKTTSLSFFSLKRTEIFNDNRTRLSLNYKSFLSNLKLLFMHLSSSSIQCRSKWIPDLNIKCPPSQIFFYPKRVLIIYGWKHYKLFILRKKNQCRYYSWFTWRETVSVKQK